MSSNLATRRGSLGAFSAAASWALSGAVYFALVYPAYGPGELGSTSAYLIEAFHAAAECAMILALLGVRALLRPKPGRLAGVGFPIAIFGLGALACITVGVLLAPDAIGEAVATAVFGLALIATFIGTVVCGLSVWRQRALPWWAALLLVLQPGFILFLMRSYGYGALALTIVWCAIGLAIRTAEASATPPKAG